MGEPVQHGAIYSLCDYEGQLHFSEASRIAADLAHLRTLWAAEDGQEIRVAVQSGDTWLMSAVLAYSAPRGRCWTCMLKPECPWHSKEDAGELDP